MKKMIGLIGRVKSKDVTEKNYTNNTELMLLSYSQQRLRANFELTLEGFKLGDCKTYAYTKLLTDIQIIQIDVG